VTITIPWWGETDRNNLKALCAKICRDEGILAVDGDDFSGRDQAVALAERELEDLGRATISLRLNSQRANTSRNLLRDIASIAEKLQPPVSGSISVTVMANAYTDNGLFEVAVDELRRFQQLQDKQLGVLIHDLDVDEPPNAGLAAIRRLADQVGGAWIVAGSKRVSWQRLQPRDMHTLNQFVRDDVAAVLRGAVINSIVSSDRAQAVLDSLFGGKQHRSALEVYSALKNSEVGWGS
jgi:hypothetical protein